jgi:hypothetical protein
VQSRQLRSVACRGVADPSIVSSDADPSDEEVGRRVAARRLEVLRRLLDLGISPITLTALLPEFATQIRILAAQR